MNYSIVLAGGVGQRMRNSGLPKQFLKVINKPIIIYTLEKFAYCDDIDKILVVCNVNWLEYMQTLIDQYRVKKVISVIPGGKDRQGSIENGLQFYEKKGITQDDIIIIHDGVRPLIQPYIISENIRVASKYGSAMTVRPVTESVVVTDSESATFADFKDRDYTYSLTSPQTFKFSILKKVYSFSEIKKDDSACFLDTALAYTYGGGRIHLVKENYYNIKITTPEDYFFLKAILELEESKNIFGLN